MFIDFWRLLAVFLRRPLVLYIADIRSFILALAQYVLIFVQEQKFCLRRGNTPSIPFMWSAEYVSLLDEKSVSLVYDFLDHFGASSAIFDPEWAIYIMMPTVKTSLAMIEILEKLWHDSLPFDPISLWIELLIIDLYIA